MFDQYCTVCQCERAYHEDKTGGQIMWCVSAHVFSRACCMCLCITPLCVCVFVTLSPYRNLLRSREPVEKAQQCAKHLSLKVCVMMPVCHRCQRVRYIVAFAFGQRVVGKIEIIAHLLPERRERCRLLCVCTKRTNLNFMCVCVSVRVPAMTIQFSILIRPQISSISMHNDM